jgi:hypothetical protein
MGSAAERIVQYRNVARFESEMIESSTYGHGHGAKVHGHVIAHGDDLLIRIEYGTGVVATFLNVRRKGGSAQCRPHFFGYRVVKVRENLDFDGITHSAEVYDKPIQWHGHSSPGKPELAGENTCARADRLYIAIDK